MKEALKSEASLPDSEKAVLFPEKQPANCLRAETPKAELSYHVSVARVAVGMPVTRHPPH